MAIERWNPRRELSKKEELLCKHLARVRTLLVFLRRWRHEIFDAALQTKLASMYRDTGAGKEPVNPALMAIATLVQDYLEVSDAEMVKLTVFDQTVQLVLDCLGAEEPAFSQGAFSDFRQRFVRADMDRVLLEHTVKIAKRTKGFDWRKFPKTLRVGIDSAPLEGAGRVEDTFNLLGHAARNVVRCVAGLLKWNEKRVCEHAGIPLLLEPSIKAGLDIDWSDPEQKDEAIKLLADQLDSLQRWVVTRLPEELGKPPLKEHLDTLEQVRSQNIEPDPGGGGARLREGVAEDRRVSIEDPEMRHGRKTTLKLFNGYKQHLAAELDLELILACALLPANRPESEGALPLKIDIERQGFTIGEAYFDRAYVTSPIVKDILAAGGKIICKPWLRRNGELFAKADFDIDLGNRTITCPAGLQTLKFTLGHNVKFSATICDTCPVRTECTEAKKGVGRTICIADDEPLQKKLIKLQRTTAGRAQLRRRTGIEHRLAQVTRRQGRRARYKGTRKNLFALRRTAVIHNLFVLQRKVA